MTVDVKSGRTEARVSTPIPDEIPRVPPVEEPVRPVHAPEPPRQRNPRPHRRRTICLLLLFALALVGWWGASYLFAYTDDAFLTSDLVAITPEITGPITVVHVTDNQWVTQGTLLFEIDPVPFRLEVEQARAREAQAQAQLAIDQARLANAQAGEAAAEANTRLATINLGRNMPLRRSGDISAQTLDTSRSTQEQSAARLQAAHAAAQEATATLQLHQVAVASAHAARLLAEWRLSRTNVVASVDGHLTHVTLQPGDMASPSHAAVAIVDAHAWHVLANYKEPYLRHLRPGHEAWVWLDARPWHLYRARIQGIARGISRDQGSQELVPFVSPTVDWIRLERRVPVRMTLVNPPDIDGLFMGTDARTLVIY